MTSVGDVVARLKQAIEDIDRAAVNADSGRAEAEQAHQSFDEAGRGTADPRIRAAITEVRTAGEKAGKVARLLSEAADHFTSYMNAIAPGAGEGGSPGPEVLPDGERLVSEASDREARLAKFHRRATQFLADREGDIKTVEQVSRESIATFRDRVRPGDGQASVGTPSQAPAARPAAQTSQHPATDILLAVASLALAARAGVEKIREIRERKRRRDDEPKAS